MPEHGTLQKDFRKAKYELLIGQFHYIKILTWRRGLGTKTKENFVYSCLRLNVISFVLVHYLRPR